MGRVVQPSGISSRASNRPLESDVTDSGNRLTGGLDLLLAGLVVGEPAPGTVEVALIGFDVVVGRDVMVASAGVDVLVVDVARLSRDEVADTAPLGIIAANDPTVTTLPASATNAGHCRRRLFRQAMAVPGSVLEQSLWVDPRGPAQRPDRPLGDRSARSGPMIVIASFGYDEVGFNQLLRPGDKVHLRYEFVETRSTARGGRMRA